MKNSLLSSFIKNKFPPRFRQAYVALGPTLITISLGMAEGFSAILLPELQKEQIFSLNQDMESWIASIAALPMPFACILGGWSMEIIGRKTVHVLCCFLCVVGWMILYFAQTYPMILIGRFITGFCLGLLGPPTGVYLAETSEPKFRGFLLALISFAIAFGITLSHLLGTFLPWRIVALACCIFPVFSFLFMLIAPESPTFLAKKRKISAAKDAFYWCRGNGCNAEAELTVLLERQEVLLQQSNKCSLSQYLRPEFIKPLMLMVVFFFTAQWCGSNAITFYNVQILRLTLDGNIGEYLAMLIMDFVRLICSILACFVSKKMGRRPLAILSCTGTFLSLLVLSCAMYLKRVYPDFFPNNHYLILSAYISYMGFLTIGLVPLPWTMTGEIFPLASRGMGSGISALINYAFIFSVVKTALLIFDNLGQDGAFFLYSMMCLLGLIILTIFLPETKDKPLHEIEDKFKQIKN